MQDMIEKIETADLTSLYALCRSRDKDQWRGSMSLYVAVANRLLQAGEALLAFDVLAEALTVWPENHQLLTLESSALARCGASKAANAILTRLYEAGDRDEETVSLLARTHKDLGLGGADADLKRRHLESAEALYREAYAGDPSLRYWSGINAATLALLLGKQSDAAAIARAVQETCRRILGDAANGPRNRYWLLATLGESALILGDVAGATSWYRSAAAESHGSYGDVASTRRNAKLILNALRLSDAFLRECLPTPTVVVFSGHMIDLPGAARVRFAESSEPQLYAAIKSYLTQIQARIGFSSAACGSDILFLEAMLELGAEINIVLPSDADSFLKASVDRGGTNRWPERFQSIMRRAKEVIYASQRAVGDVYLVYANILMYGLARSQARRVDGELRALAVWDGAPGNSGGTASAVSRWRDCGQPIHVINPLTLESSDLPPTAGDMSSSDSWLSSESPSDDPEDERKLVSMLFADAVGFSKLQEEQIPKFVAHFLQPIAALIDRFDRPPIVRNTWGDAVYFAFNDIAAAGRLALDICDLIGSTQWAQFGLPEHMGIRIGLHSGPAFPVVDPIIKQFNYTGVHVSRAARIEPITPPGAVYASQAFAALAEAVGVREFACDYVGKTVLAKNYGEFPTYRVRRT
jgi:class 3 adenylate cyclase